ncbi:hypothetical protein AYI69_g6759 [Smittium culicis]|uniref:STEEP1 domain-containing protein n=1 Tax=Smittium culicis TaxID=133412 RepID=A0A1R1XWX8_9FUNG|nr:hypothetical protein AYI69_g10670 [Smittium culicis]OMJ19105.1 hypothetical protein AYI69_g6759 [Smittium culicis]
MRRNESSVVSSNERFDETTSSLKVYYCLCGEYSLISRKDGGFEKQYQYNCIRCRLPIAYETADYTFNNKARLTSSYTANKSPFTYIYDNALVQVQGHIPEQLALSLDHSGLADS